MTGEEIDGLQGFLTTLDTIRPFAVRLQRLQRLQDGMKCNVISGYRTTPPFALNDCICNLIRNMQTDNIVKRILNASPCIARYYARQGWTNGTARFLDLYISSCNMSGCWNRRTNRVPTSFGTGCITKFLKKTDGKTKKNPRNYSNNEIIQV